MIPLFLIHTLTHTYQVLLYGEKVSFQNFKVNFDWIELYRKKKIVLFTWKASDINLQQFIKEYFYRENVGFDHFLEILWFWFFFIEWM